MATSVNAVSAIYAAKNRPNDNPLICHFSDLEMVRKFVEVPKDVEKLFLQFPKGGAFSCLVNLKENSPLKHATAGLESVIIRIPAHQLTRKLISEIGAPLAAPSANTSGTLSPVTAEMVEIYLGNKIDGVLDGGQCDVGLESTILDLREAGRVLILRDGGLPRAVIKEIFPEHAIEFKVKEGTRGAKYKHYAPKSEVRIQKSEVRMQNAEVRMQKSECRSQKSEIRMQNSELRDKNVVCIDLVPEVADKELYLSFYKADLQKPDVIFFVWKEDFSDAVKDRVRRMVC